MREGAVARGRQPLLLTDRTLGPEVEKVNSFCAWRTVGMLLIHYPRSKSLSGNQSLWFSV
jgi:hypothetical protein